MARKLQIPQKPDRPLRVQGYAKTKLVTPRNEKDLFATPDAFKARARLFSLIEPLRIQRLDRPSLISSLHGQLERILFTIPYWVFFPDSFPGEEPIIRKYQNAFRSIIEALPPTSRVILFTNQVAEDAAKDFMDSVGIANRTELILAPNEMQFTVWAEDAYCICSDLVDNETYFVEPASFNRAQDAYIADRIAPVTDLESTQVQLYFQGGNVLIGDDFWFIGADYPSNSLELGFIVPNAGETERQAVARVYGQYLDAYRRLIVIGSRVPVPSQIVRPVMVGGQLWKEVLYFGNHAGTVQASIPHRYVHFFGW